MSKQDHWDEKRLAELRDILVTGQHDGHKLEEVLAYGRTDWKAWRRLRATLEALPFETLSNCARSLGVDVCSNSWPTVCNICKLCMPQPAAHNEEYVHDVSGKQTGVIQITNEHSRLLPIRLTAESKTPALTALLTYEQAIAQAQNDLGLPDDEQELAVFVSRAPKRIDWKRMAHKPWWSLVIMSVAGFVDLVYDFRALASCLGLVSSWTLIALFKQRKHI